MAPVIPVEVVTVARDGARTARCGKLSFPIFVTAVYRAIPRQRDGVITYRRVASVRSHATAGRNVTGPMIARAEHYANQTGRPFVARVRHGDEA